MSDVRRSDAADGHEELPVELQVDLLVDGELDEENRRMLLRRMEELGSHAAVGWRELALRFVERQVEKESVKQLMQGGRVVPVEFMPPVVKRGMWRRVKGMEWERPVLVVAGMLIAVTSAVVTVYAVRGPGAGAAPAKPQGTIVFDMPAEAVGGASGTIPLNVPLVSGEPGQLFPGNGDDSVTRRSWVIQPDGTDKAVVVPVNLTNVQVR